MEKLYCGLRLNWNYCKQEALVSMTNYATKALQKIQHSTPRRAQYEPHQWTRTNYGATKQLTNPLDTSPPIPEEVTLGIHRIVDTLLYYACSL